MIGLSHSKCCCCWCRRHRLSILASFKFYRLSELTAITHFNSIEIHLFIYWLIPDSQLMRSCSCSSRFNESYDRFYLFFVRCIGHWALGMNWMERHRIVFSYSKTCATHSFERLLLWLPLKIKMQSLTQCSFGRRHFINKNVIISKKSQNTQLPIKLICFGRNAHLRRFIVVAKR